MTRMASPDTTTVANLTGELFVFGSWLTSQTPKDLDLLFVYDETVCSPQAAVAVRHTLKQCGASLGFLNIDVVLLSRAESIQCRFIELEGAVPLQKWADQHCDDLLWRLIDEATQHL
jgi:hypothetical protein